MEKTLACSMIVRDEASTLQPLLEAIRPYVDELVIVDSGSTDNTPDIAEAFADVLDVWTECNDPETGLIVDFSAARNRALELTESEWMFWVDGDDIVENVGWFMKFATDCPDDQKLRRWVCPYEYAYDDHGRCMHFQSRERLVYPRSRFIWEFPVHESLLPRFGEPHEDIISEQPYFRHVSNKSRKPREPGRNLRILLDYLAKTGEADGKAIFQAAREFMRYGKLGQAARFFQRAYELQNLDEYKCQSAVELCGIYRAWGSHYDSVEWGMRAIATKGWQDPYFEVGKTFLALAKEGDRRDYNLARAVQHIAIGVNLGMQPQFGWDPREQFAIHRELSEAYELLGNTDGAIESCDMGLRGLPEDTVLMTRLSRMKERKLRQSVQAGIDELLSVGGIQLPSAMVAKSALAGEFTAHLLKRPPGAEVPREVLEAEEGDTERPPATEPGKPSGLDIAFYTGEAYGPWNPETIEREGMGGSETMAYELARRLVKRGHRVRIFGHLTPDMTGIFDGVEYIDRCDFPGTRSDVLIASRYPEAIDDDQGVTAAVRLLWLHDVDVSRRLDIARAERFDRVMVLSAWHELHVRLAYPFLRPEQTWRTRNGIDLARFDVKTERNPLRAIWSSSPDRGLVEVVEAWPEIRKQVPEAELRCFYGFDGWELSARYREDKPALRDIARLKTLLRKTPGVTMVGKVNGRALAREMLAAGVWGYSTHFTETACCGAMEAQAAGLRIVTSDIAALTETVGTRGVRLSDRWNTPEYRRSFVREMVDALTAPDEGDREEIQKYARENFDIETLADEWDEAIRSMHAKKIEEPIEAYRKVAE